MANNALAFITGLGTGYISAKEKEKDRARQEKKDAQDSELHDARMYELNKTKRKDAAAAEAYKPATVNENAVTLDISGKPVVYEDAGVAGSDFRQARALQESNPAAAMEGAPALPPVAAPKPTFAAGGVSYGDKAAAQAGADAYNTPDAGNKRAATALRGIGDHAGAAQLEATSRQGKLADIQLTKAEQDQVHELAFREVTESFSRQGWNALPKIYENYNDGKTAKVAEDGKGGAIVTVFDDQGKQVGQKVFKDEMSFITESISKLDPKQWVTMKAQQVKDDRAQGNWQATHNLALDSKGETRRHNMALEGLAGQRIAGAGGSSGRGAAAGDTTDFQPLGNFDAKKAQDVAFSQASKVAEGRASEGKPMSADEQGRMAQQIYRSMEDSFAGENTRRHVAGVVSSELRSKAADPAAYAESFAKAKKLGFDDKTLAGLGFKAPAGAPAAGPGTKAMTVANPFEQAPNQAAAGIRQPAPASMPAPMPAAAPAAVPAAKAAPTQGQQIRSALGASGGSAIDQIVGAKAPAIEAASSGLQQAQLQLQAVAKSGDPQALQVAASKVQNARNAIDAIVKDMNKPQADAVRQAAGYFQ